MYNSDEALQIQHKNPIYAALGEHEYVVVYQATSKCPLSFTALVVHGFLRRKAKAETPPDYKTIAEGTGVERFRAVPRAVKELVEHGLAERSGKGYRVTETIPEGWFALQISGKPKFFRLYILASRSALTATANALYWLMVSLDSVKLTDGSSRLANNSKSGLASILGVTRETVHHGLRMLSKQGLWTEDKDGMKVSAPISLDSWLSKTFDTVKDGNDLYPLTMGTYVVNKIHPVRMRWDDFYGFTDEDSDMLFDRIDQSWDALRSAGYWQSDAIAVLDLIRDRCMNIFHACNVMAHLPEFLKQADEFHSKGGKYRCSLFVLLKILQDRGIPATRPSSFA